MKRKDLEKLTSFCNGLIGRAGPVSASCDHDAEITEYFITAEDLDDLKAILDNEPPSRPDAVDGLFRGDPMTGKNKEIIREYIERLEA
ncbi:MAG: hypothetical protein OCC45_08220 [Desulfotalea sp.]